MSKRVKKIDSYTNETIKEYPSAQVAGMLNGNSAPYVINQCKRKAMGFQEYYYRWADDEPTAHKIIEVYDLDFEKVAQYVSIKDAEAGTGVGRYSISKQLHNEKSMRNRRSPSSGLYFVWKEVL